MVHHLLSVDQFDPQHLTQLFELAHQLQEHKSSIRIDPHIVSTNLFYEPSTRTSSSFYSAMVKLGGHVIPINDVNFSSVSKGETLEDTIQVMAGYSDVIVLRHPEQGACARAAAVSKVPIINAGDGVGEHPTQALLDLYTIQKYHRLNGDLRVALVGDLKHGRTVHSLLKLLRLYDVQVHLVSPAGMEMPDYLIHPTDHVHQDLQDCVAHMDVIYMTRVQKERIQDPLLRDQFQEYRMTTHLMDQASSKMILMHPLPRVTEIGREIDADPRAVYFNQTENGLYVRQAIFLNLFNNHTPSWNVHSLSLTN